MPASAANQLLLSEAAALDARLRRLRPLSLEETRVPAAEVDPRALLAIERHVSGRVRSLSRQLEAFAPVAHHGSPLDGQRALTQIRMRFNLLLSDYDIFADALTQRSEPTHGTWLAGLDVLAADALKIDGIARPPLICYLDRGRGAAIRRARTRLPTGSLNPVAVVRLPRERLVGSGIASSLFHEVGHQGSALLDLVSGLQPKLAARAQHRSSDAWQLWARWISEILADVWAVARAGVCAPVGLMSVVSLPAPFVFRIVDSDPHPCPWVRVLLSAAVGQALYPSPHWSELSRSWRSWYPLSEAPRGFAQRLAELLRTVPELVTVLLGHRVPRAGGRTLEALLRRDELHPSALSAWGDRLRPLLKLPASLAIAAVGLARLERRIDADGEAELVDALLQQWAVRRHFHRLKTAPQT